MIKFSLFPTLVLYFPGFISSKECDKIFKLLKTKKLYDHPSLIKGKSTYDSNFNTDILSEISVDLNKPLQEYSDQSKIKIINKIIDSWFNIQDKESVLKEHAHPNAILSGGLFINVGKKASQLYFHNPNPFVYYTDKKESLNDYTYEWLNSFLYAVVDFIGYTDFEDFDELSDLIGDNLNEWVDSEVSVYTSDLTEWLNNNNNNVYYMTEVSGEYKTTDGFDLLRQAQYKAIEELFNNALSILTDDLKGEFE